VQYVFKPNPLFQMMTKTNKIRQPIVTVCGHVDHGKTSILDCFRGTCLQGQEAGGITQKISFTKFPLDQVKKICPLLKKNDVKLEIPGFLFIDTPGHAAFTNLRKRGGSLADLAILVISIKEGIKPQTAEVLQILRQYKTPFLIALNKIDSISGWKQQGSSLKDSIEKQSENVKEEFQTLLLTLEGSLSAHGFDSDLYYEISDFSKKVALVPCSARTKEGISELLFVLCGLSEKFLKERLKVSDEAKGVILEVKKEKTGDQIEAILYDGTLKTGDEIAIATFDEPIVTKVRALEEIEPLCPKYKTVSEVSAATGIQLHLTNKEGLLSGMIFQKLNNNLQEVKESFRKELSGSLDLDKQGIIIKADSLGSLEALIFLLKQGNINVVKAGIGTINKKDIINAKTNLEIDVLNAVIAGFNVGVEEDVEIGNVKILTNNVIYKLIEDLQKWMTNKKAEIERERLLSLATICKLEILHKYLFRNSNPAVFGVRVSGGRLRTNLKLIDETGEEVARVKAIQHEKESISQSLEGSEVAISLPGVNFERRLGDKKFLYSEISESQFKNFKKNKDLLSASELKVLQEIATIKQRKDENWGA
jgi:translation initiation factor 5B